MADIWVVQSVAGQNLKEVVPLAADAFSDPKRNLRFIRGLPATVRPVPKITQR
jgi:hypothetical protein